MVVSLGLLLGTPAWAGGGDEPGDTPPTLETQLAQRIQIRDPFRLPSAAQLTDMLVLELVETTAELTQRPEPARPRAIVLQAIIDAKWNWNQPLSTNLEAIRARARVLAGNAPPISVDVIDNEANALFRVAIRSSVFYLRRSSDEAALSDAFVDAAYNDLLFRPGEPSAAKGVIADYPQPPSFRPNLDEIPRARLAEALKHLRIVDAMKRAKKEEDKFGDLRDSWRARVRYRSIVDNQEADPDLTHILPATQARVSAALRFVAAAFSPDYIQAGLLPAVWINVHRSTKTRWLVRLSIVADDPMRAYAEHVPSIHIDDRTEINVIVHELGHYLENQLPLQHWLAIQRLLRGRHAAAGGGPLLRIYDSWKVAFRAGVGLIDKSIRDEARYNAKMLATSNYSAKVMLGGGPTEVFSMTMQRLYEDPDAMIQNDPLVAAIILYALDPADYLDKVKELDGLMPIPIRQGPRRMPVAAPAAAEGERPWGYVHNVEVTGTTLVITFALGKTEHTESLLPVGKGPVVLLDKMDKVLLPGAAFEIGELGPPPDKDSVAIVMLRLPFRTPREAGDVAALALTLKGAILMLASPARQ